MTPKKKSPHNHSPYTPSTPYSPSPTLHISKGNTKIGKILNTNLLPGDNYANNRSLEQGSCVGCCSTCLHSCYAKKALRYDNVIIANSDNAFYARTDPDNYFNEIIKKLSKSKSYKFHRWHSSGEIPSKEYLANIIKVAAATPNISHYIYTKRYEWVNDYITSHKDSPLPSNLTILFSPPFTCDTPEKISSWNKSTNPHNLPLFIYDDHTTKKFSSYDHCPAVDSSGNSTGITCDKCQRCIKGKTTAVYSH